MFFEEGGMFDPSPMEYESGMPKSNPECKSANQPHFLTLGYQQSSCGYCKSKPRPTCQASIRVSLFRCSIRPSFLIQWSSSTSMVRWLILGVLRFRCFNRRCDFVATAFSLSNLGWSRLAPVGRCILSLNDSYQVQTWLWLTQHLGWNHISDLEHICTNRIVATLAVRITQSGIITIISTWFYSTNPSHQDWMH